MRKAGDKSQQLGTSRKRKRRVLFRRLRFRLVPSCCVLICLAFGCESGWGSRQRSDPLLGIQSTPKPVGAPSAPSNPTVQASSGPIPPMPASYTAAGTTAVASGEMATPENPREIRMTGDTVSPTSLPSAAARGSAPAVNIGNPEPAPPGANAALTPTPVSRGLSTPAPASTSSSGSAADIRTYEDAQRFLKQHGVTWQRMSGDGDEWKFACGIPNPSNPHINKTYQTSKPFPDLLSAMRAIIAQIEQTPH